VKRVFLDIETTGLSPDTGEITLIGILVEDPQSSRPPHYTPLVHGKSLSPENLEMALEGAEVLYTFNGKRFDIPWLRKKLGFRPEEMGIEHRDIYFVFRAMGFRGGQKALEKRFGVDRYTSDINGRAAAHLGRRFLLGDRRALVLLLTYNFEDVRNLRVLTKIAEFLGFTKILQIPPP